MRIRHLTPFVVVFALACGGGEATEEAAATAEAAYTAATDADAVAAVAAVAEYWETHYNMGHGSMVASQLVDDGILWSGNGGMLYGREAIEASLNAEIEMASPQVQIGQDEALIFGDFAMSRGSYSVSGMAEGESMMNSGNWIALSENIDGEWKLHGVISNLDSDDQTVQPGEVMEMPEAGGAELIAERSDYYETHFNMGHASMVADTYTDDALVMGSGEAAISGREAILERLTAMTDAGAQVSITPWSARALDDQHVTGIGTYTIDGPDGAVNGHYAALYKRDADGTLQVHWLLTSNHPTAM